MAPKATLQGISKIISNHGYTLLYYHDPLLSKRGQNKTVSQNGSHWDTTFLFPFLLMITSSLYGNFFMVYSEANHFSLKVLKTSPRIMYHQVAPPVIWVQTDFAWTNLILVATALYAISFLNPCTLDRYQVVFQKSSAWLSIHGKSKLFSVA